MNLAQTIYQKSLALTPEKAKAVIDFIDFIQTRPNVVIEEVTDIKEQPSLLQTFEEAGLVGCLETDEQLSTTYKEKLNFANKHSTL